MCNEEKTNFKNMVGMTTFISGGMLLSKLGSAAKTLKKKNKITKLVYSYIFKKVTSRLSVHSFEVNIFIVLKGLYSFTSYQEVLYSVSSLIFNHYKYNLYWFINIKSPFNMVNRKKFRRIKKRIKKKLLLY